MLDQLGKIRAKIERAKHHIRELETALEAFAESDPYRIKIERNPEGGPEHIYKVVGRADPPIAVSLIAGDAIHNLRSALDHVVCHLVSANGETITRSNAFPIFERPPEGKIVDRTEVKGVPPAAVDLIEAAQPYKTGSSDLRKLHELDIADKHKLLLIAGFFDETASVILTPIGLSGARGPRPHTLDFPFSGAIPESGREVGRFLVQMGVGKMEQQFKITAKIAFTQPQIVYGDVVLELLKELADVVESLVGNFAPWLK